MKYYIIIVKKEDFELWEYTNWIEMLIIVKKKILS